MSESMICRVCLQPVGGPNDHQSCTIDAATIYDPVDHREAIRIVRELAGREAPARWSDGSMFCALCDAAEPSAESDHEPGCIWRRARALYP